jgi:esterase FrsA
MPASNELDLSASSRREFFARAAAGAAVMNVLTGPLTPSMKAQKATGASGRTNPFRDAAFADGRKMRIEEFVRRGADHEAAEAIFNKMASLDAEPWVAEWSKLAEPFEYQAAQLESQGKLTEANKLYLKAATYYGIAKFPCINHPAKQAAYKKVIENYLKGARSQDPPMERVEIPFEGKKIIGYLRKPKGVTRPPVVIATGGVDVYKEERNTADILSIGAAAFSMDMPGAGESPAWNTPDAEKLYITTIDYLLTRNDLDGSRMGFVGRSYAGYWGGKMAYVEAKRLKASAQLGGPIHYTWQEPWLRGLLDEKEYFWNILDSMIYSNHVKDFDELVKTAPAMSLKAQGWLDKPSAPMIIINGAHDPWISPQEIPLLLETGSPKTARIIADGKHMGRDSKQNVSTGKFLTEFLSFHLKA